jgi:hypothetical protein
MLRSAQLESEDESDLAGEITGCISDVGDAVVEAIQKIKFPTPTVEAKYEPRIQVTVPELKQPVIQLHTEAPKPPPHPFANGLVLEVTERDSEGKIFRFTIKPL